MKRAGISLALVVMLLLGAAAPVPGPGRGNRAGGGGGKLLPVGSGSERPRNTANLSGLLFGPAPGELRAELPQRCGRGWISFCSRMKLPSITPVEENTQQKETGWQLDASTTWDDAGGQLHLRRKPAAKRAGQTR